MNANFIYYCYYFEISIFFKREIYFNQNKTKNIIIIIFKISHLDFIFIVVVVFLFKMLREKFISDIRSQKKN